MKARKDQNAKVLSEIRIGFKFQRLTPSSHGEKLFLNQKRKSTILEDLGEICLILVLFSGSPTRPRSEGNPEEIEKTIKMSQKSKQKLFFFPNLFAIRLELLLFLTDHGSGGHGFRVLIGRLFDFSRLRPGRSTYQASSLDLLMSEPKNPRKFNFKKNVFFEHFKSL